jgi:hypothetical protein
MESSAECIFLNPSEFYQIDHGQHKVRIGISCPSVCPQNNEQENLSDRDPIGM